MHAPSSHMNDGLHHELISGTHHSCERREYVFMVLREYTIISHKKGGSYKQLFLKFSTYIVLIITNSQVTSKGGLELSIWNAMPCLDFGQDLTLKDL